MKVILNKVFIVEAGESSMEKCNADLIRAAVNNTPTGGFSIEEMKARVRILDVIDSAKKGEDISFEDADFAKLKECVSVMKWAMINKSIIDFCNLFD